MAYIQLKKGKRVIVDDEDYEYLSRFSWVLTENKVGDQNVGMNIAVSGKIVRVPMWRFIVPAKIQRKIIYKNRNPLDHRKENLYLASPSEFNAHCGKRINNKKRGVPTSIYKGVSYHKKSGSWIMTIQIDGKAKSKVFKNEIDAAIAYDEKAKELYGDIAYQNLPT